MAPAEQAKAEQDIAQAMDMLPPMWMRMYKNLLETGFDEEKAYTLLKVYVVTSNAGMRYAP